MAYSADWTLSQNATFQNQVQMAVFKAAVAISSEARTVKPTLDSKRHSLASQVLTNFTTLLLTQFVLAAIEASALVSGATDAQVDSAVSSVWNGVAGVSAQDLA